LPDRVPDARRKLTPLHARLVELRRDVRRVDHGWRLRRIGFARRTVTSVTRSALGCITLPAASVGILGLWIVRALLRPIALLLVPLLPLLTLPLLLRGRLALLLLLLLLLLLHPLGGRNQFIELAHDALLHASRGKARLALIEQLRAPSHVRERAFKDVLRRCACERRIQVSRRGIA
jgi:hypothetical protein